MDQKQIMERAQEYIKLERDPQFRNEVVRLVEENNISELSDRFYTDLEFGTGGLRGVIGGGYNRMNSFVVQRATQGLANYVKKAASDPSPKAVIAYDSRRCSDTFALEAALVLAANGIKTYLFSALRPTPELSFAVRKLKATTGIVVTASHNPKEYNGYKVYWDDGSQVLPPHDKGIIGEVLAVTSGIKSISKEEALAKGSLVYLEKDMDDQFIDMVKRLSIRPNLLKEKGKDLKVVYTPLCGTGAYPVSRALSEMGVEVTFVPEQKNPDPLFAGLVYPNPEEASAMQAAIKLATSLKADLVMGTDPDADRIGIACPGKDGFTLVTGNQLGVLLADYLFSSLKELGTLPSRPALVKTIVTTELGRLIAEDYGARSFDVLTGFKYIAEKMREFENTKNGPNYVMGYEESYGYLLNTDVRDKDAISAATITCEMTLYHLSKGKSILDRLTEIYLRYGYFEEVLISRHFKGEQGLSIMAKFMDTLRKDPPRSFAGQNVSFVKDYKDGTTFDVAKKTRNKDIDLPSSNVLQFCLSDSSIVSVRPSGTEPKIKFYASCTEKKGTELELAKKKVKEKIEAVETDISSLIEKMSV
jgi:phosphoglucomutase